MLRSLTKWAACCLAILSCPALAADTALPSADQSAPAVADGEFMARWGALGNFADKDLACTCNADWIQFSRWDTPGEVLRVIRHSEGDTTVMAFYLWPDGYGTFESYAVDVESDGSLTPRPTRTPVSLFWTLDANGSVVVGSHEGPSELRLRAEGGNLALERNEGGQWKLQQLLREIGPGDAKIASRAATFRRQLRLDPPGTVTLAEFAAPSASPIVTVGIDPWGPLDDMVGRRFKRERAGSSMPDTVNEFSWELPGRVLRDSTVGTDEVKLYRLDPRGGVVRRWGRPEHGRQVFQPIINGEVIHSQYMKEFDTTTVYTLMLDDLGQPVEAVVLKSHDGRPDTRPKVSSRYVEEGSTFASKANELRNPARWGPLATLANKSMMMKSFQLHLRVSDDGEFIEFIQLEPGYNWLFGLLRADGDGRFRFFQRGFNARDDLHEGRLMGDTLVLPSLVEPGYEVSIRVYDEPPLGPTMRTEAYGSPEQSWLMKAWLQPGVVFENAELAKPLKTSAEQRAEFESYFTPTFISRTIAYHREQRASFGRIDAEVAEQEAELAAVQAEMEAQRRSRPNFLEAVAGAYAEATADNDQMRRTLDQATRRGIAEGNAIRRQREQAGSGPGSSTNGQPGLTIADRREPAASPQAPAEPETRQTYAWCMALRPNQNVTYSTVQQITIPNYGWSDSSMAQDFGAVAGGGVSVCSNTDSRAAAQAQLDSSKTGHRGIKQTTTSAILRP